MLSQVLLTIFISQYSTLADEFGYLRHREEDLDKDIDWRKYFNEADGYFRKAKSHVRTHAMRSFDELHLVR